MKEMTKIKTLAKRVKMSIALRTRLEAIPVKLQLVASGSPNVGQRLLAAPLGGNPVHLDALQPTGKTKRRVGKPQRLSLVDLPAAVAEADDDGDDDEQRDAEADTDDDSDHVDVMLHS